MKKTINFYGFVKAFTDAGRAEQFSREALAGIFDYIEQAERDAGEELELDVIAICCDFTEASWQDIVSNYSIDISDCESDQDYRDAVQDYLDYYTHGFSIGHGDVFVYVNF